MEESQQLQAPGEKKTWTTPELIMLDIRSTMAPGDSWQFVQEGEFWKREIVEMVS